MLSQTDTLRARFNLAVGYANRALTPGAAEKDDLQRAAKHAEKARDAATELRRSKEGSAAELATNIHAVATLLLAGVLLRLERLDPDKDSTQLARVDELHKEIVRFRSLGNDPGVAYALACYYTERGEHREAIGHLVTAFVAPSARDWARSDPWLAKLRTVSEWKSLFSSTGIPSLGLAAALDALGLQASPVAFEPFEPSGQVGWQAYGVVLVDGEPAHVVLAVAEPAAVTPEVTIEVRSRSPGLRSAWVRVGSGDTLLPLVQRADQRTVFRASLATTPGSWDDTRVWLVINS